MQLDSLLLPSTPFYHLTTKTRLSGVIKAVTAVHPDGSYAKLLSVYIKSFYQQLHSMHNSVMPIPSLNSLSMERKPSLSAFLYSFWSKYCDPRIFLWSDCPVYCAMVAPIYACMCESLFGDGYWCMKIITAVSIIHSEKTRVCVIKLKQRGVSIFHGY